MKILFLGPQGSGKSTQAKQIAEKLNVPYIEMGRLLREKSTDGDEEAIKIKQALAVGNLVPDKITIDLLNKRLSLPDATGGFVIDGYPRNKTQVDNLPDGINKVFYFNIPDDIAVKRLSARGREDDTSDVILRRLELFHQETEPLIDHFKNQGIFTEIDASKSIENVKEELERIVSDGTN